jgi:hypothetical protein
LHPKVSRAVIKILQDRIIEQPIHKIPECELDHHFNAVKSALNVLGIELDDYTIEQCVRGNKRFIDVMGTENTDAQVNQDVKVEEISIEELENRLNNPYEW